MPNFITSAKRGQRHSYLSFHLASHPVLVGILLTVCFPNQYFNLDHTYTHTHCIAGGARVREGGHLQTREALTGWIKGTRSVRIQSLPFSLQSHVLFKTTLPSPRSNQLFFFLFKKSVCLEKKYSK